MKKALIIGNSNYIGFDRLKNPGNDANAISEILAYKGFETEVYFDQTSNDMRSTFDDFVKRVNDGDHIFYFYAGHAIEFRDSNYLLSVDLGCGSVEHNCLTIDYIQNQLNRANKKGVKLLVIDACRNNNFAFEAKGLKKEESNLNTLIAFSTSPGSAAKDGKNELSYYTKYLIDNIKKYNISINDIFRNVRESVIESTKFEQIPWEHSSLTSEFSFENIFVPTKLEQISKLTYKQCYSIKNIGDGFLLGGNGADLYKYVKGEHPQRRLRTKKENDNYAIEEIDCNQSLVVFIDSEDFLVFLDKRELKVVAHVNVGFTPYTVSINNDKVFVAGSGDVAKLYDLSSNTVEVIDLEDGILKEIYSNDDVIEYKSRSLTIMCSTFAEEKTNILAFGGSDSIFFVKDILTGEELLCNKNRDLFTYTYSISFSNDGKYIATGHDEGKVLIWDARHFTLLKVIGENNKILKNQFFEFKNEKISNDIMHLKFSNDSKFLGVGTSESKVMFFDVEYNEKINEIDLNVEPLAINSFDFDSCDESLLVSINDKSYEFKI